MQASKEKAVDAQTLHTLYLTVGAFIGRCMEGVIVLNKLQEWNDYNESLHSAGGGEQTSKVSQDEAATQLHAHAASLLKPELWCDFNAKQLEDFLVGYALAGVTNIKITWLTSTQAVVPPGRVALPVTAMYDANGIDSMFQPLFDTVHITIVTPWHMQLAPCVVDLHCPLQGTSATSAIRSALTNLYMRVTTQLRLHHSTHLQQMQSLPVPPIPTATAQGGQNATGGRKASKMRLPKASEKQVQFNNNIAHSDGVTGSQGNKSTNPTQPTEKRATRQQQQKQQQQSDLETGGQPKKKQAKTGAKTQATQPTEKRATRSQQENVSDGDLPLKKRQR